MKKNQVGNGSNYYVYNIHTNPCSTKHIAVTTESHSEEEINAGFTILLT